MKERAGPCIPPFLGPKPSSCEGGVRRRRVPGRLGIDDHVVEEESASLALN